jgi:hypothetical protein
MPGLTIHEAAASDDVIIGLLVAVAVGLLILIPSLYLLYGLVLGGRFDPLAVPAVESAEAGRELDPAGRSRVAVVLVIAAVGGLLLFISDGGARLYIGLALFMIGLAGGVVLLARSLAQLRD